jgi:putative ABC transport system substrate-binding protein
MHYRWLSIRTDADPEIAKTRFRCASLRLRNMASLRARGTTEKNSHYRCIVACGSAEEEAPFFEALREGFNDLGYIEGQNIRLEHRFPNEIPERFRSMAAELVALKVDVLVSVSPASIYVKDVTTTIPHVFTLVTNPVSLKLVDSYAHPGGNTTGTTAYVDGLVRKRFQLLHETIPAMSQIGFLVNSAENATVNVSEGRAAAAELGLALQIFEATSLGELEGVFESMTKASIQGLVLSGSGLFFQARATIAKLAIAHRLPTCGWTRQVVEAGAFLSYGADLPAVVRRTPVFVDKILNGAKPADLPVEQPTKFEFFINLKTAKAIAVDVPPLVLARADEVIE